MRPMAGPHSGSKMCRRASFSMTSSTSSSPSRVITPRAATAASAVRRSAFAGVASQPPSRREMPIDRSLPTTTSSERNSSSTKAPSVAPISSLRFGMIAVCGIRSPSGYRNSAVTANQSASAPTIAPSAAART